MNDLQLFQGLAKQIPLEPITDAERYYAACNLQEEYQGTNELPLRLYLAALGLFVDAYEHGYRAGEDT